MNSSLAALEPKISVNKPPDSKSKIFESMRKVEAVRGRNGRDCASILLILSYSVSILFIFFLIRNLNVVKKIRRNRIYLNLYLHHPNIHITISPLLPFHSSLSRPPPSSYHLSLFSHWNQVKTSNTYHHHHDSILDLFLPLSLSVFCL